MECCDNRNDCEICKSTSVILGIIVGVAVGILFSVGLIPLIINFLNIALVASAVGIGILLVALVFANNIKGGNAFWECACKFSKLLLAGSIGTLRASTITLIIGVAEITILSSIFVGISAFFFILMIVSIICLINCVIKRLCRKEME